MSAAVFPSTGTTSPRFAEEIGPARTLRKEPGLVIALITALSGTTTAAPWKAADETAGVVPTRTSVGELAESIWANQSLRHAIGETLKSDSEELLWVKEVSGLTWEQLGKVLGVSRRSVHLWANGGRMNESNAAVLRAFSAAVNRIPGNSPGEKRSGLLAIGHDGQSIVDRFRRRQGKLGGTAWGSPFTVDELLGALPDENAV